MRFVRVTLRSRPACERARKLAGLFAAALVIGCLLGAPRAAAAQEPRVEPAATESTEAGRPHEGASAGEEAHAGRGWVDVVARLVNFGILFGTLWYLLKSPLGQYLTDRGAQIRRDLVEAAEMRRAAGEQIAEIDRRLAALPRELDELRAQGAAQIAAEEVRIRTAAAAERERLLEQAKREIDLRVKVAERDLVSHAADLALAVASDRIKATITDEDQTRLVDRYVGQLKG
jgi:F-type H+-transporting ATPase subunit b